MIVFKLVKIQWHQFMLKRLFNFSTQSEILIQKQLQFGCRNYAPLPVVLKKGQGVFVWDCEDNKYFDFISAYSAINQGHCHPYIMKTFIDQVQNLTLSSRAVHSNQMAPLLEKLNQVFGYEKALLMNSGVEAGESAVKIARRWGYFTKNVQSNKATVLFATGNFWGRTIAACASSDDPHRYKNFGPYGGLNFQLVQYGNLQALQDTLKNNKNIVAYMLEPIQGQKGVVVPPQGYMKSVSELLQKYNCLMICDQVQTGLGRTGRLLASQYEGVRPDILVLGKALSGGFYPVSAVLCDADIMDNIRPGQHGSTYGGNPLGCSVAVSAIEALLEEQMTQNSDLMGKELKKGLNQILKSPKVHEIRGKGLFIGVEFKNNKTAGDFSLKLLKKGLLAKTTQKTTIRFAPPLIMTKNQLNKSLEIIEKTWNQLER